MENTETSVVARDHEFRLERFWSVVRLYRFDEVPAVLREWRDTPSGILETFRGVADGEFQTILIGGRVFSGLENGSLVNAAVKSGSELIDHLAEFKRELGWKSGEFWPNINAPCPVSLYAYKGRVVLVLDERIPSFGDGISVSLCPFDTLPTALEWSH